MLHSYAFVTAMQSEAVQRVRSMPFVQWVGVYHPAYKIAPSLLAPQSGSRDVIVSLFPRRNSARTEQLVNSAGGAVKERWTIGEGIRIRATIASASALDLALLPEVSWIEEYVAPTFTNSDATWVVQSDNAATQSRSIHARGIQGEQQIITMADGSPKMDHAALVGKVIAEIPVLNCGGFLNDKHGTFVAGILAGDYPPSGTYNGKDGHAFKASLISENLGASAGCIPTDLYNSLYLPSWSGDPNATPPRPGARIHANGFGTQNINCAGTGYNDGAEQTDRFVYEHQDFVVTIGAGNEGDDNPDDPSKTIRSQAQAKSPLTVGATWNGTARNQMAAYSSRGPTCDGRRKPTVVAPGGAPDPDTAYQICSTSPTGQILCFGTSQDKYVTWDGTSFAHPVVAGSSALVRQYFAEGWYPTGAKVPADTRIPSAALIKAVLINGAVEMTDPSAYEDPLNPQYPNNVQGWGRIHLDNSLYFQGDARKLAVFDDSSGFSSTGEEKAYQVQVTGATEPLEVTLVWSDYQGTVGNSPELRNDVDVVVKDPVCTEFKGNVFSGGESATGGSRDGVNVEEGVLRKTPATGMWFISVRASNIVNPTQPFALAITGDMSAVSVPARIVASSEHMTGLETIVSGSYVQTQASDDAYEVLKEVSQGGVSVLEHVWQFDSLPPTTCLTLNVEGRRTSSDGDNFKFQWSDSLNGTYVDIPNAVINKTYEITGGTNYPFVRGGTPGTIFIKVKDTGPGSSLDTVYIDRLEIRIR